MKKEEKINYKIDSNVLKNYVEAINSIKEPMNQIKEQLNQLSKPMKELSKSIKPIREELKNINTMSNVIKELSIKYPNEQAKILTDTIKQIMNINNGMLSTRMIEPLNISRQYLSIMENNNDIEKVSRGIYLSPSAFEDSYFSFQQKYKKAIFSHMNALYFYGMTEEFPYNYTVTVPQSYHVDTVNEKCNVFYVSDDIYELEISSRMKDYYDIYLIYKFKFDKINKEKFRGAVEKTFRKRGFDADLITNFNIIKGSNVLKDKWISYSRKNSYASNIKFDETLKCLEQFIDIIIPVVV